MIRGAFARDQSGASRSSGGTSNLQTDEAVIVCAGGKLERPGVQRLLADIQAGRVDIVVVYKVDRLTRSLADFARLVEIFDAEGVSFVSVAIQYHELDGAADP